MWQDWINGVLGVAVIVVAFLGLTGNALVWTLGVLGAVIAIVGFWGAGVYVNGSSAATSMTS